jgi:hypothetical protein
MRGGSCAVTRSIGTYIDRDFALSREPRGHPCNQDHRERVMVRERRRGGCGSSHGRRLAQVST